MWTVNGLRTFLRSKTRRLFFVASRLVRNAQYSGRMNRRGDVARQACGSGFPLSWSNEILLPSSDCAAVAPGTRYENDSCRHRTLPGDCLSGLPVQIATPTSLNGVLENRGLRAAGRKGPAPSNIVPAVPLFRSSSLPSPEPAPERRKHCCAEPDSHARSPYVPRHRLAME